MSSDDNQDQRFKKDATVRIMHIDPALMAVWKDLTIKELYETRDRLVHKMSILPAESAEFHKTLAATLRDLETYIAIRQQRENPDAGNNVIV